MVYAKGTWHELCIHGDDSITSWIDSGSSKASNGRLVPGTGQVESTVRER
jgi:hypothetical protein